MLLLGVPYPPLVVGLVTEGRAEGSAEDDLVFTVRLAAGEL